MKILYVLLVVIWISAQACGQQLTTQSAVRTDLIPLQYDDRTMVVLHDWAPAPPPFLQLKGSEYDVQDLADWSRGTEYADTSCADRRIRLLYRAPNKRAILLHEMMHVATNCQADPHLHAAIMAIAPQLLKLMQDNPDMVKYLMEGK